MAARRGGFRHGIALGLLVAMAVAIGCAPKPRAPALVDGAVYQNDKEGFRFAVPDGWFQQIKTDLPPGPVTKERTLVQYRVFESSAASLEVAVRDFDEEPDVEKYLTTKKIAGTLWKQREPVAPVSLGDREAQRYSLEANVRGQRTFREVIAYRRGKRLYLFNGMFLPGDTVHQEQIRQALAGLRWTDR